MIAVACVVTAVAVPVKRGAYTHVQGDGTLLSLQAVGDEFMHYITTTDGLQVELVPSGDYCYRVNGAVTAMRAHNVGARNRAELQFVAANLSLMKPQPEDVAAADARRRTAAPRRVGATQIPTSGSPRVPIILVEYSDKKMSNTREEIAEGYVRVARQYFIDQSNGKYDPQFDVYGIYSLDKTRETYGKNRGGQDIGVALMVNDAIDQAGDEIDWSLYDNDNDGEADVVIVLYAGVGEAQAYDTVPTSVWPCQWKLSTARTFYNDGRGAVTRNGVRIDRFAVFNEINGSNDSSTKLDGVGTFCHEFSHCLGLPDFYETSSNKKGYYGMGSWSLMHYGCYNNDGYTPVGYSAYEKAFMGWIELVEPTENTLYTLPVFNQKNDETDVALKIVNKANANEYYVIENRQPQGWDEYMASDGGLLITHVAYSASSWQNNTVNNSMPQRMSPVPCDNSLQVTDEYGDLWPYNGVDALTDESTPSDTVYTGGYLGKPITEITQLEDGRVSFYYVKKPPLTTPVLNDASEVVADGFTATWSDDIEIEHTYTLVVSKVVVEEETTSDVDELDPTLEGENVEDAEIVDDPADDENAEDDEDVETVDFEPVIYENITEKQLAVTGLPTDATYEFKVKAIPLDATEGWESEWSEVKQVTLVAPVPELTVSTESLDFGTRYLGEGAEHQNIIVTGLNLKDEVTVTLSDEFGAFAVITDVIGTEELEEGFELMVTYAPATAGEHSAQLRLSSSDVEDVVVILAGIAEYQKEPIEIVPTDDSDISRSSFLAEWTPVRNAVTYTLHVLRVEGENSVMRRAPERSGDDDDFLIEGITTNYYVVEDLLSKTTYDYAVKAVYPDMSEGEWSATSRITTKGVATAINEILKDDASSVEYYDVQGHRLNALQQGVNIVVVTQVDGERRTIKVVK